MYNDQKKLIRAQKIQERVKNDVSLSLYFVDHILLFMYCIKITNNVICDIMLLLKVGIRVWHDTQKEERCVVDTMSSCEAKIATNHSNLRNVYIFAQKRVSWLT